jgi:hypothetical protein
MDREQGERRPRCLDDADSPLGTLPGTKAEHTSLDVCMYVKVPRYRGLHLWVPHFLAYVGPYVKSTPELWRCLTERPKPPKRMQRSFFASGSIPLVVHVGHPRVVDCP